MTRNILLEMGWDALYLADEAPGFERRARARRSPTLAGERGRGSVRPLLRPARSRPAARRGSSTTATAATRRTRGRCGGSWCGRTRSPRPTRCRSSPERQADAAAAALLGHDAALPRPLLARARAAAARAAVARITSSRPGGRASTGRGELRPGAYADVVLLDLDELGDRGTFLDPEPPGRGRVGVRERRAGRLGGRLRPGAAAGARAARAHAVACVVSAHAAGPRSRDCPGTQSRAADAAARTRGHVEPVGHGAVVERPGAAERDQREVARVSRPRRTLISLRLPAGPGRRRSRAIVR